MVLEQIAQNVREQRREEETTFIRTTTPGRPAVRSIVKKVDLNFIIDSVYCV